ncbi:YhdH/YhfP family quinone oxidoreductase [Halocola ammonii]
MSDKTFKALVVKENRDGSFSRSIANKKISDLPDHEVLIRVKYAGLNYKDALSASGHKGVTRKFPHTPGVDACGAVEHDASGNFKEGEEVICTSYDLGMNTHGGFAEYIRVPAAWVVKLPPAMTLEESMVMGTAAYTAGLALYKMQQSGQLPEMGEVVVTGASGGVGSMAVSILAKAGFEVIASSGKKDQYEFLKSIGAKRCVGREETDDDSGRPLIKPKWAGGIDTVGGNTLATLLKACDRNGNIATCGLVASPKLETTVYPFILNGVNLLGVDSAETPMAIRQLIWDRLANEWKVDHLDKLKTITTLEEIPGWMDKILKGETVGRVVAEMR